MRTPRLTLLLPVLLVMVATVPPGSGERDGSFAGMDTAATATATATASASGLLGHGALGAVELRDVRLLKDGGDGDRSFFKSAESLNTECECGCLSRSAWGARVLSLARARSLSVVSVVCLSLCLLLSLSLTAYTTAPRSPPTQT